MQLLCWASLLRGSHAAPKPNSCKFHATCNVFLRCENKSCNTDANAIQLIRCFSCCGALHIHATSHAMLMHFSPQPSCVLEQSSPLRRLSDPVQSRCRTPASVRAALMAALGAALVTVVGALVVEGQGSGRAVGTSGIRGTLGGNRRRLAAKAGTQARGWIPARSQVAPPPLQPPLQPPPNPRMMARSGSSSWARRRAG